MTYLLRGALVEYGTDFLGPLPNVVIFQFNPESISRTITVPTRPAGSQAREVTQAGAYGVTVALSGQLVGMRRHVNGGEALPGQAALEGELDLAADGRPLRLLMVTQGTFKLPWDHNPRPTGAVIDWQAGAPVSSASFAPRS